MSDATNDPARTEAAQAGEAPAPAPNEAGDVAVADRAGPPSGLTTGDYSAIRSMIADAVKESIAEVRRLAGPEPGGFGPDEATGGGHPQVGGGGDHKLKTGALNPNRPDTPNNDFIHGVKGKLKYGVTVGGVTTYSDFFIEQISVDDEVDTDDITNSSSGGGQVILDGIQKISGTITFVYDALNCFLVAPLPWRPRTYVTLQVMPDGVTIGAQFCALINGYSYGTGPKAGTVRVACKYMSTGPITYPTASQTTPTAALTS